MEPKIKYKKITGVYKNFLGRRCSLWQGPDHLLSVFSNGMMERYKRFYYQDIQGLVITSTPKGKIVNIVLLCCAAPLVITAFFQTYYYLILALPIALMLAFNLALGKTCVCLIFTAAQTGRLPGIMRHRYAKKFINRLVPLINQAQCPESPESVEIPADKHDDGTDNQWE